MWLPRQVDRRQVLRWGIGAAGIVGFSPLLSACGDDDDGTASGAGSSTSAATGSDNAALDDLIAAAKEEGQLNAIALPPDWSNYGEVISTFESKYGITVDSASPNASSAEELEAVKSLEGQDRAPDVLDVGPAFAAQGKTENLFLQHKNSFWDSIPDAVKDPDGYWVGDYGGVIAFGVNADVVDTNPASWADLASDTYRNQVALNGDPRTSGSAFAGVWAAALANGGTFDDILPGVELFGELREMGNFIPVDATPATVASGQTPITVDWDYLQAGYGIDLSNSITWNLQVPEDGIYAGFYCQAINVGAPNPNCAKLWQEFLYSDEGQLLWLKGFARPVRLQQLIDDGAVPEEMLAALPQVDGYDQLEYPTQAQIDAAKVVVGEQWGPLVAGN